LWKYHGTDASPAMPEVRRKVGELVAAPFDEDANWATASRSLYLKERQALEKTLKRLDERDEE
jgi:hypothetical protein